MTIQTASRDNRLSAWIGKLAFACLALVACKPTERELRALAMSPEGCTCVCDDAGAGAEHDAGIDAPVDAPPDVAIDAAVDAPPDAPPPISLNDPWVRTVITAGSPTGPYRGADGVALDPAGCIVTAWEEGGIVTRACPVGESWLTELVVSGIPGAEDAKAADLDGDGVIDVVTCSDGGARCYITFRGAPNVTTVLPASIGHGRAMQAAIADVDGDGLLDVIFGTRVGAPAVVARLKNPGAILARNGSAWTYEQISEAGWVMSLVPLDVDADGDMDVVISDRAKNGTSWALYGSRWSEQTPGGWVSHPISPPAGGCGTIACTPADEMMLSVVDMDGDGDLDVLDGTSNAAAVDSRIVVHRNDGGWLSWTHTAIPPAPNVGHYQHAIARDVNGDGLLDIVVSTWKGNSYPLLAADAGKSGVYAQLLPTWERVEISGVEGGKFDNLIGLGACVVTTEQLDPPGGLGVVRYCLPGAAP